MTTPAKRPPAERGQGKKSLQGEGRSPVLQVVVTPAVKAAAMEYGMDWVRDVLDKAIAKKQKAREVSNESS